MNKHQVMTLGETEVPPPLKEYLSVGDLYRGAEYQNLPPLSGPFTFEYYKTDTPKEMCHKAIRECNYLFPSFR